MTLTHISHFDVEQVFPAESDGRQNSTNNYMVFFVGSKGALTKFAQAHGLNKQIRGHYTDFITEPDEEMAGTMFPNGDGYFLGLWKDFYKSTMT